MVQPGSDELSVVDAEEAPPAEAMEEPSWTALQECERRCRELQVEHDGLRRSEREWRHKLMASEEMRCRMEAAIRVAKANIEGLDPSDTSPLDVAHTLYNIASDLADALSGQPTSKAAAPADRLTRADRLSNTTPPSEGVG